MQGCTSCFRAAALSARSCSPAKVNMLVTTHFSFSVHPPQFVHAALILNFPHIFQPFSGKKMARMKSQAPQEICPRPGSCHLHEQRSSGVKGWNVGIAFISTSLLWHNTFLLVLPLLLQSCCVFEHLGRGDDLSQMYLLHFPNDVFVYFLCCFYVLCCLFLLPSVF